ncbi:hypothetical protein CHLRE_06g278206v5 [Chlamydomonas reinhardtii]|uniref:Uncharacterized protein n=1 Tax=Chlamydomonas reinhardtii TaxID=3055 RepID=A0A2K3DP51_CHLRE|nr:uncharacterized protein CHLRE_06g278206v5 [Chlamydomonas reinhardtii]PNW82316.1 hypothetical protein CHLRE_06g278206v5 [Chlamydomonas reinhardtii]
MAANTVPAMSSASGASAGLVAPGAGPITSKADDGERSRYCAQLHALRAVGASVPDADLGDAVCIVHQANRSGSPGEVVLGAKVDKLSADVGAVKAKLDQLSVMMVGIKAGQNNVVHRNMNGNSRMAEHNLQPLKAEEGEHVGEYPTQPDLFPATLGALFSLNNPQLDKLEEFYNCEFKGTSIAAWQSAFTAFIGALSARP